MFLNHWQSGGVGRGDGGYVDVDAGWTCDAVARANESWDFAHYPNSFDVDSDEAAL